MRRWNGGSTMSMKASTAALDRMQQRLRLLQRRTPRHPAGGFKKAERTRKGSRCGESSRLFSKGSREATMKIQPAIAKTIQLLGARPTIRRRFLAAVLLGAVSFLMPAVAAAAPLPHKEVRTLRADRRAIENLQRWVSEGHDGWCRDAQLVASAEMRRLAPDFSGYQFDLASLPLLRESGADDTAIFSYTSFDGRRRYRITLRRYLWLKAIAGEEKQIVWVPAETEVITKD
jgi:hypothetical protein